MASLHLLSSTQSAVIERCLDALRAGDALVLHADGVLLSHPGSVLLARIRSYEVRAFVLEQDCRIRGLNSPGLTCCSYPDWVRLTTEYSRSVSWI